MGWRNWHNETKKEWADFGKSLGFDVETEYNVKGGRIDVVWSFPLRGIESSYEEGITLFCIEVETGVNRESQIHHNILKCGKLSPACLIMHFRDREKIKEYIDLKKQVTYPIIFTDHILYKQLRKFRFLYMPKSNLERGKKDVGKEEDIDQFLREERSVSEVEFSEEERKGVQVIRDIVDMYESEPGDPIFVPTLLDMAESRGIDRDKCKEILNKMRKKGEIWKSAPDMVRRVLK